MSWTPLTQRENHAFDEGFHEMSVFVFQYDLFYTDRNQFEDWILYGCVKHLRVINWVVTYICNLEEIGGPTKYQRKSSIHVFFWFNYWCARKEIHQSTWIIILRQITGLVVPFIRNTKISFWPDIVSSCPCPGSPTTIFFTAWFYKPRLFIINQYSTIL